MAGFFLRSLRVSLLLLCFFSPCRPHKARALVQKLKTPFKCRLLVPLLSVFLSSPPCVFLSHRLASCACCVTYAPLPPGCTPSVLPRDRGPVVALWNGWEKTLEPHYKEKKSLSLWGGGVAPGHRGALWFPFFSPLNFPMTRRDGSLRLTST